MVVNRRKTDMPGLSTSESTVDEAIVPENSTSAADRPLPPLPSNYAISNEQAMGSIVLFYQYREPVWTETEFQIFLKKFIACGRKHAITGRGRIATEGVNCTLTGASPNIRAFCQALRDELDPILFAETDFKITDNIPKSQLFKSFSMRKTEELVAYGLANEKAPSIKHFGGTHLNALDYHKALCDPNAVVIDVRNQYETAIGTMKPPPGGAKLIDPKLRNSHEWPKWLASKKTQKLLNGKKVMMFCTGGIRCERAAALVNQMAVVAAKTEQKPEVVSTVIDAPGTAVASETQSFQPQGVYQMQGGIERYLRTFPTGGFWSGKNYLFDKRMEQRPEYKDSTIVEQEVSEKLNAKCCHCRQPWTSYRGKFKCSKTLCGVPVIVCESCQTAISMEPQLVATLQCELCREGYRAPQNVPDLVALRLQAEKLVTEQKTQDHTEKRSEDNDDEHAKKRLAHKTPCRDRLFLSRLPLNVRRTQIQEWLRTPILNIHWLTDKETGAFYGSCLVQVDADALQSLLQHKSNEDMSDSSNVMFPGTVLSEIGKNKRRKRKRQRPKIAQAFAKEDQIWPPLKQTEFPPLGDLQ